MSKKVGFRGYAFFTAGTLILILFWLGLFGVFEPIVGGVRCECPFLRIAEKIFCANPYLSILTFAVVGTILWFLAIKKFFEERR